jgi:hypothetical protein
MFFPLQILLVTWCLKEFFAYGYFDLTGHFVSSWAIRLFMNRNWVYFIPSTWRRTAFFVNFIPLRFVDRVLCWETIIIFFGGGMMTVQRDSYLY